MSNKVNPEQEEINSVEPDAEPTGEEEGGEGDDGSNAGEQEESGDPPVGEGEPSHKSKLVSVADHPESQTGAASHGMIDKMMKRKRRRSSDLGRTLRLSKGNWGNHIEFLLTMVGYAVGLGNVWRFPCMCYWNGGGAVLIPYILSLILVGIPLYVMEICMAQFSSLSAISVWHLCPIFKGIGFSMVCINSIIGMYYTVICAEAIRFVFASMAYELPWVSCNNFWNTETCATVKFFKNISQLEATDSVTLENGNQIMKQQLTHASKEYYTYRHLERSNSIHEPGHIVWPLALSLLLAWTIITLVLIKGIHSLGKVSYFTTTFSYLLLFGLLVRGVTLEGSYEGLMYYLSPDWAKLKKPRVWSDAAAQIFYSLSISQGGVITMASYNRFNANCRRDGIIVPIINCLTSFIAGLGSFSILGSMALQKGVRVGDLFNDMPEGTCGSIFIAYSEAVAMLPIAPLWSVLFFMMVSMLGLSSMFSIAENFLSACTDQFQKYIRQPYWRQIVFRIVSAIIFYIIGLSMVTQGGTYVVSAFDLYIGSISLLISGIIETIVVTYVYGFKRFNEDVKMMIGKKPGIFFDFCWCLTPVILLVLLVSTFITFKSIGKDGLSADDAIGIFLVVIAFTPIPFWWVFTLYRNDVFIRDPSRRRSALEVIKESLKPDKYWHPILEENQTGIYAQTAAK